jgi:RNA polymerase sigma-70 factor, ECF subfamily
MPVGIQTKTDEELACDTQAGSLYAFEELLGRFEERIYRFIAARTRNLQDAEDLTQQVFMKAYHNIEKYNPAYRFSTWVYTIARRQVISHYRRQKPEGDSEVELSDERTPFLSIAADDDARNLWQVVYQCLSENQSTVLWLKYHEDFSVAEIARSMQKTQTHVKVLLHRGRQKLAAVLADSAPASDDPWANIALINKQISSGGSSS